MVVFQKGFFESIFWSCILFNILSVLCWLHFTGGTFQCSITPGNKNLTKHPSRVIVVLNCTFNRRSVDTVIWTRNGQQVEDEFILEDSTANKKWSAVVLYASFTPVQDDSKFTCKANRGQDVVSSCSVHPGKILSFVSFLNMVKNNLRPILSRLFNF